ncbi:had-superfamily hydrolase [Nannochloropsis gaditana]|uniref:Had-superfamily hydrolase n=1 Tax=Nannochloropsis gaditana TaxID=72520 RepID=W7T731_9STRA|nr:had-superfamily hydrolase [Nannochloropsis gaditana]
MYKNVIPPGGSASTSGSVRQGTITNKIKAIVYDLDGTLLDTESLSTEAIQAVVGAYGKTFTWDIKKKILGMRGEEWGRVVVDDLGLSDQIEPMMLVKQWERELEVVTPTVQLLPGAREIIQFFDSKGLPQAIATSSSALLVAHKRTHHEDHVFGRMRTIVTGDDPKVVRGKPAPDIYLEAAQRLGVAPEECLVFEDALTGVLSGKAAGMFVVAIPDPRLDAACFQAHAHQVLKSLDTFDPRSWGWVEDNITFSTIQ